MTHMNLFDLKGLSILNDVLGLITKLQDFGPLPKQPKCIYGHIMYLTKDQSELNNVNHVR